MTQAQQQRGSIRRTLQASANGFTLLEILVAMAIFAVIGIMALSGYNELSRQSNRVTDNMQRVRSVQLAVMRIAQDFSELEPRPVRDELGTSPQPALLADGRSQFIAQFTRAGWSNPAAIQRPTLQRVAYRLDDGKLYRDHWPVLDRMLTSEPQKLVLIDHVRSFKLRFMDRNRNWTDQWPQSSAQAVQPIQPPPVPTAPGALAPLTPAGASNPISDRPIAVEATIELEDWGTLVRLIEVPG